MPTFNAPLPDDVQSVQPAGHLEHHSRLRAVVVELRNILSSFKAADISDATVVGRAVLTAATAAAARQALGTSDTNAETILGGSVLFVRKNGSVWPPRPTARTDIMVLWIGADPSPDIVASGTGGMIDGVDGRWVAP